MGKQNNFILILALALAYVSEAAKLKQTSSSVATRDPRLPRGLQPSQQQGILDSMQASADAAGITMEDDDYGMINLNTIEGEPAMNTESMNHNVPAVSPWWASYASDLAGGEDEDAEEDDEFEISGNPFSVGGGITEDDPLGLGIEGEEGSEAKWKHRQTPVRKTSTPCPPKTSTSTKPLNGFQMAGSSKNYDGVTSSYNYPGYDSNPHGSGIPDKQVPYGYPAPPAPKQPSYPSRPSYPSKPCCCDDHYKPNYPYYPDSGHGKDPCCDHDDDDKSCTEHISTDWKASGHYEAKTKVDQEGDCCSIHTVMGANPACYMPANAKKSTTVTHSHHDGGDCGCCH